ncbi:hypothetical protein C7999DRAFT_36289 [Corynascus novoguineensis]|uniref:Uncharacterized protein n=1 Tax=Corynascus novoguineensis TaxID=1126955 RepID=A0AAN7HIF8_9PEZI|nr:hypothetical protein C7999DRAFT_36289 [Corynascus novoguineensis]
MANLAMLRPRQLPALLLLLCHAQEPWAAPLGRFEPHIELGREFNYVVVGGGPGALTIAKPAERGFVNLSRRH